MSKLCLVLLLAALVTGFAGCAHHSGSREYIPGKGWVPND